MRADTINMFRMVAIMAKKLKTFLRKTVFAQPGIEVSIDTANVLTASSINMVYGKECRIGFTATGACIPICSQDLFAKSIPYSFVNDLGGFRIVSSPLSLVLVTMIAKASRLAWTNKARTAHSGFLCFFASFVVGNTPITSIHSSFSRLSIRSLWPVFLISFLPHIRVFSKFCNNFMLMTTFLTSPMQTVFGFALNMKISSRQIFLAARTVFLLRRGIWLKNNIVNGLGVQIVKIECALRGFLRYTVIHNGSHFLLSRLQMFQHRGGKNMVKITSALYHKPASEATLSHFLELEYYV